MQGSLPWRDLFPAILGAVGFVLGVRFVTVGYKFGKEDDAIYSAPQTIIWMTLIAAQVALWFIAAPRLVEIGWELRGYGYDNWLQIAVALLMLLLLLGIPSLFKLRFDFAFRHLGAKLKTMTLVGVFVGVIAITDMLLVQAAITQIVNDAAMQQRFDLNLVQSYLARRDELQQSLSILGGIIGLATLATGALRNAALAAGEDKKLYPSESVLVYGLYYTAMVALIYVPIYLSVAHAGEVIRDGLLPLKDLNVDALADFQKKHEAVEQLLELHGGAAESLQSGLAILAPLGSSIVAVLLSGEN